MSDYLNFDKRLLQDVSRSLSREVLNTNRAGAYMATSVIDCNTRKYHGQLVVPLGGEPPHEQLNEDNYVLLSSLDETVVQYGAEFNLGVHRYGYDVFSPNGHKYLREFECSKIFRTTYRIGSVILVKERLLVSFEPRVLIRYTIVEAGSGNVTLRLKPFLAFRSVNELTHQNDGANTDMDEVPNGRKARMYPDFPYLFMQTSRKNEYHHAPTWYKNIEYFKEQERGYDYKEDLFQPGYFELSLKKGESVIFSAGISEAKPTRLKALWEGEEAERFECKDMFLCIAKAAQQFYKRVGDKCYLLAGYPWFKVTAREEFFSLCSCTIGANRPEYWETIVDKTAIEEIEWFMAGEYEKNKIREMDEPDALLWFVRSIQKYAEMTDKLTVAKRYGAFLAKIIHFVRTKHPRIVSHANGLLWVDGTRRPATWMNAVENGWPITPRTGYVVELNALWYNDQRFVAEMLALLGEDEQAELMEYNAELLRNNFVKTFWNGSYLYDYVVDNYCDKEVRPNQIWAVSFPYSPLDKEQQKAIVDICTRELHTPKGLRTISPKSGNYRPMYRGGQQERNHNYHNGPVWPLSVAAYGAAYIKVYHRSGESFLQRLLDGFEADLHELCVGTLNELYDGNPPFKGHGAMSYAPSISAVITLYHYIEQIKKEGGL